MTSATTSQGSTTSLPLRDPTFRAPQASSTPGEAGVDPGADELARVTAERDEYLETLQRVQAEYDNYRRRSRRELADQLDRGGQHLAEQLLPVLDAFDSAAQHDAPAVEPLRRTLHDALAAAGLERLNPAGAPFDPTEHEALEHEPADTSAGDGTPAPGAERPAAADGAVVVDVLRTGYRWRGRVLRPALVRVRG